MEEVSVPYYRDVEDAIGGPIDMAVATKMGDTATRTQPLIHSDFLMALGTDTPRRLSGRGTGGELTPSASGSIHSSAESLDGLQEWMEHLQKVCNVLLSYPDLASDRESTEYQKPSPDIHFTSWLADTDKHEDIISWLADTDKHEDIIVVLRLHGLDKATDRLNYLLLAAADDPDEAPIELESLRQLARFLIVEQQLPHPRIAVSPDGLMQIEWHSEDSGIIAVKFLLDGKVQFAGVAGRIGQGIERERVSGTLQKDDMMRALHPFISRLGLE